MDYKNIFFASPATFEESYISFELREFLQPKRFFPRTNILTRYELGALSQTQEIFERDGKSYNRIDYYNKYPHYILYFRVHKYRIPVEKSITTQELGKDFLAQFLPLIIKYQFSPFASESAKRYTKQPIEESEAKKLLNNSVNNFFQNIETPRPS